MSEINFGFEFALQIYLLPVEVGDAEYILLLYSKTVLTSKFVNYDTNRTHY